MTSRYHGFTCKLGACLTLTTKAYLHQGACDSLGVPAHLLLVRMLSYRIVYRKLNGVIFVVVIANIRSS